MLAIRSQCQVGVTHCSLEGGLASPDAPCKERAVPITRTSFGFCHAGLSSVRHVASRVVRCNAQTSRRSGAKVGPNPVSVPQWSHLPGTDPAICPAQAVIRAQALQTTQPPPLQSMENVVSVSSTAKASKDDLEMSKVGADCPGWSLLGVARQQPGLCTCGYNSITFLL